MTTRQILFLLTSLPTILFGQTQKVFLSDPLDKLIIGETTIKQTEKILGAPTENYIYPGYQHRWERHRVLIYNKTKADLRFGYKSKVLFQIILDSISPIKINGVISVRFSDSNMVLKTFGIPKEIFRSSLCSCPTFYYELDPYDVRFSFDGKGILQRMNLTKYFTKAVAENYKTKQFNCAIFPSTYIDFPIGSSDRFTPTHEDVDKAELALKTKLAALTKDNPTIYKNLKHYRRQYIGYKNKNGQNILIINCMRTKDEDTDKDWLNKYIMTLDGGSNYWNINFNLDTDTLFNLSINGVS